MLDIKLLRTNPEIVKENIKKKFQDEKIALVDKIVEMDKEFRATKTRCDELRSKRNTMSKQIGGLMAKGLKDEAEKVKDEVKQIGEELAQLEVKETELEAEIRENMMVIPNIID
ncbi:MAG: serine--tRNA ligase, partial [Clostridia bacterium]|nr:serine--tRNA ligase [Clostridia bacterium]